MARERDKLLGAPRPDDRGSVQPVVIGVVLLIIAAGAGFIVARTSALENGAPTSKAQGQNETGDPAVTEASEGAGAKPDPAGRQAARAADPGTPQATSAEFLITDALLRNPATYEDLEAEAVSTSVCIGDTLRIGNVSSRRVGLSDTPEASDASVSLGFVEPGAVFTIRPLETGTFYISEPDSDGLLFRYRARRCSKTR